MAELLFGFEAAHPSVELLEQVALFGNARAIETLLLSIDQQLDAFVAGNDGLERQPPELAEPIGKAGWDVDRKRHLMLLEDRIGPVQRIPVAIVYGDAYETPTQISSGKTTVHFVEADEIEPRAAQPAHNVFEEARPYFEKPVRLKAVEPGRAHMMQSQDNAEPGNERAHEVVSGAEIQRLEAATNKRFLE